MKITQILSRALKNVASLTDDEYQTLVNHLNNRLSMSHMLTPNEAHLIAILPEFQPAADDEIYLADHIDDREYFAHEYGYDIGNRTDLLQCLRNRLLTGAPLDEMETAMLEKILGVSAIDLNTIEQMMTNEPLNTLEAE